MRRGFMVVLLVVSVLGALSSPAAAQKDPFDPVIDPNAATTTTITTGTSTGTSGDGFAPPAPGSEALAPTGADVTGWLAVAYALLAAGATLLVVGRRPGPTTIRR